jgi:hypothetical protein
MSWWLRTFRTLRTIIAAQINCLRENIMLEALKPAHSRAKRLTKTMAGIRALLARIRLGDRVQSSLAAGKVSRVRRIKITVESERVLVVVHKKGVEGWCPGCGASVRMVGLEEAVAIAAVSRRVIFRRMERRELHFSETTPAELLICLDSLLKQKQIAD